MIFDPTDDRFPIDLEAQEVVGVQIGTLGHKLWVCVDGVCVLRVKSPKVELTDQRVDLNDGVAMEITR